VTGEPVWIWGRHPVLEALRSGTATSVLLAAGRRSSPVIDEICRLAILGEVPLREIDPRELQRISPSSNMQGVAAEVRTARTLDIEEILSLPGTASALFLVLDEIQDPHNLGALLRSASAAGADGVILPERRTAPLTGTVAKASAGAVARTAIAQVTNLARALERMRDAGIWTVGLDGSAETLIYEVDLTAPVALVIGNEGRGLRRLVRQTCDFVVRLPMRGEISSLNASVAGGIALFEAVRQRIHRTDSANRPVQ